MVSEKEAENMDHTWVEPFQRKVSHNKTPKNFYKNMFKWDPKTPLNGYKEIHLAFKVGDLFLINLDVDSLDKLKDGSNWKPPQIKTDLAGGIDGRYYSEIGGDHQRKVYSKNDFGAHIQSVAALELATFAAAVVQIYLDSAGDLERVANDIGLADLNFATHGDTFFEIFFTGGRLQPGTTKFAEGVRHRFSVIDCEPKHEALLPSVLYLKKILSARPSLVKHFENVMQLLLQMLKLFEEMQRKKLAIFTGLSLSQKLPGLLPEAVLKPFLKDDLISEGIALAFITEFFKEYLIDKSIDDLISLLKHAKVDDNLQAFFPSTKRSPESLSEHFTMEGLTGLVKYNEKMILEVKLQEMKFALTTQIAETTEVAEMIKTMEQLELPKTEIKNMLWDVIMDAVQLYRNQQQNGNAAQCQVKPWAELLNTFFTSRVDFEVELMQNIQMLGYQDAKLVKLFPEIVKSLYHQEILSGKSVIFWYNEKALINGREIFKKALAQFVDWLVEDDKEEKLQSV